MTIPTDDTEPGRARTYREAEAWHVELQRAGNHDRAELLGILLQSFRLAGFMGKLEVNPDQLVRSMRDAARAAVSAASDLEDAAVAADRAAHDLEGFFETAGWPRRKGPFTALRSLTELSREGER